MIRNKKKNKEKENKHQRDLIEKKEEHPFRRFLFELYYTIYSTD